MEERLTENGKTILIKKGYIQQGETVASLVDRVANAIALRMPYPDRQHVTRCAQSRESPSHSDSHDGYSARNDLSDSAEDVASRRARFAQLLDSTCFIPNTPCLMNAGHTLAQLAACFVLPITDDLGTDAESGIFSTLRNAALIQQTGGGVGFDWSDVRAKGSIVSSSGGTSSGPISFLHVYNEAFGKIAQGGIRRGANMGVLRVDHPDIEEFIECKSVEGAITNFNLSVAITEEFMRAVTCPDGDGTHNHDFALRHVHGDRAVARIVDARELMRKIAIHAHANGEPGVIFIDRINEDNPVPELYHIAATNPCVARETVVMTDQGPRFVYQLIREQHNSVVDDTSCISYGFFMTGFKQSIIVHTREGLVLHVTPDHHVLCKRAQGMISADQLGDGDEIAFSVPDMIKWGDDSVIIKRLGEKLAQICALNPRPLTPITDKEASAEANTHFDLIERCCEYGTCSITSCNPVVYESSVLQAAFLRGICEYAIDIEAQCINCINVRLSRHYEYMMYPVIQCFANFGILTEATNDSNMRVIRDARDIARYIRAIDPLLATDWHNELAYANNQRYVTVKQIENAEQTYVYDCVVNDRHTFSANGMVVSNCGEVNLGPYENCCLGHINLARLCDECGNIDLRKLEETVTDAVEFLDCVVSSNRYVPSVPQLEAAALAVRRIGLGITGLADVLLVRECEYGSPESFNIADLIMASIRVFALGASTELARKWGAFPECARSVWAPDKVTDFLESHLCKHLHACAHDDKRDARDCAIFAELLNKTRAIGEQIKKHGIRNGALTVIAPTGTTSLILGVDGYGCEPVFSNSYTRTISDGSKLTFCRDSVMRALEHYEIDSRVCQELGSLIAKNATIDACSEVINSAPGMNATTRAHALQVCRAALATALNVSWRHHLEMQAHLQTWIDNSISKTINCPHDTTVDDVMNIYIEAWRMRLKGVAIYRTASRAQEILVSVSTPTSIPTSNRDPAPTTALAPAPANATKSLQKRNRPAILHGLTSKYGTLFGNIFTTVNFDEKNNPFELFITVGKSGTEVQAESEAIGRLISLILRMDSSIAPISRVEAIIKQLSNIGGSRDFRDVANRRTIRSIPDAVAIQLREIMTSCSHSSSVSASTDEHSDDTRGDRDICPLCKGLTLVKIERCVRCINEDCSYSACS